MANQTKANHDRTFRKGDIEVYPVKNNEQIYAGQLVSIATTGNDINKAVNAGDTANTAFVGVAENTIKGDGTNNQTNLVRVKTKGIFNFATRATLATTAIGTEVKIKDNQTVATTGLTQNIVCGVLSSVIDASNAFIYIKGKGSN